jgi:N-acetylmuramoyl-L-alanine amidase
MLHSTTDRSAGDPAAPLKTILIDPGHGGSDPGAVGNGLVEKELTLKLSFMMRERLAAYECNVRLTRTDDRFVSLPARAEAARSTDLFLSIHINAHTSNARGFETFVRQQADPSSKQAQRNVHEAVMAMLPGVPDRGRKAANFQVLRASRPVPAVLVEYLFLSSTRDAELLADEALLERMAGATVAGAAKFLGLSERASSSWIPPVARLEPRPVEELEVSRPDPRVPPAG